MPFTTFGYGQSVDEAGIFARLNALADQSVTVASPEVVVPSLNKLVLAAAMLSSATVINEARIDAPSIRDICRPYIKPVNLVAAAASLPQDPFRLLDRRGAPITMSPGENVEAWALADPAAAQWQYVLLWLADAAIAQIGAGSEMQAMSFTGATTAVANAWTNAPITFDEALPVGHYQVVGMRAEGASLVAARLVFKGYGWRPGCLGNVSPQQFGSDMFRNGNLGLWGEFDSINPPTLDILCNAADTAQYGILDLIKTA
jgi:hypothetical protein